MSDAPLVSDGLRSPATPFEIPVPAAGKPRSSLSAEEKDSFVQRLRAILTGQRPSSHGYPPEMPHEVQMALGNLSVSKQARQRITEEYSLQYYYGGSVVAYRKTDKD